MTPAGQVPNLPHVLLDFLHNKVSCHERRAVVKKDELDCSFSCFCLFILSSFCCSGRWEAQQMFSVATPRADARSPPPSLNRPSSESSVQKPRLKLEVVNSDILSPPKL